MGARERNSVAKQLGFSVIEILVALGISTTAILGGSYLMISTKKFEMGSENSFWLSARRLELQSLIKSDAGWTSVLALNSGLDCLSADTGCASYQNLQPLKVAISGVTLDGALATTGMTNNGDFCQSFDAVKGNNSCPVGVKLSWQILCDDQLCKHGQPKLSISFQRKMASAAALESLTSHDLVIFKDQTLENLSEVCRTIGGVLNSNGVDCQLPQLNTICDTTIGNFVLGFDADTGSPICGKLTGVGACAGTDVVTGFTSAGDVICSAGCP